MPSHPSSLQVSIALLVVAMLSIQGGASLAKTLFPVLGAQGISALRLGFATLILGTVWKPWKRRITGRELRAVAAYGLALGAMNLTFYMALERLPLGLAVALEFTGPLSVAILSSRRALDFLWVSLALAGIVLILPVLPGSGDVDPVGVAYALVAGVAWALYIILGKKAATDSHAGQVTSLGMGVAALLVLPFGVAHSGAGLLDPKVLPLALAVAVFSSAIPYSLEMMALKRLPARNFGILMSLEPVVGAVVGFFALNERLGATQWVAIGAIMMASIGSSASIPAQGRPTPPIEA